MDTFSTLHLLAELDHEHCHLNHGPGVDTSAIAATDYIVAPVGYREDGIREVSVRDLVIPVCQECAVALLGNEWTLLFCLECGESRWIYRHFAKNRYRHHILWLKGCPDCSGEFGGLYFNDPAQIIEQAHAAGERRPFVVVPGEAMA